MIGAKVYTDYASKLEKSFPCRILSNFYIDRLKSFDSSQLFQLVDRNRDYLKQTLPWLDRSTEEKDSEQFIEQANSNFIKQSLILGIKEQREQDVLIGIVSFRKIDWDKRDAHIGYWLDQEMQHKGIMTAACEHIINIGFKELELKKIFISCSTSNTKSKAIAKRLDFVQEGIIKNKECLYGNYVDHITYSITNKDQEVVNTQIEIKHICCTSKDKTTTLNMQ